MFSFRAFLLEGGWLCIFSSSLLGKSLALTSLSLGADAGGQAAVSLFLKESRLIRVRCYYLRGS